MTDLTADPPTADLTEVEPVPHTSPLPPPPADGRPAPEGWVADYLRGEATRTGMTLTDEDFASMVLAHQFHLQYPGRYVVCRNHNGVREGIGPFGHPVLVSYRVREEFLFHAADEGSCEAYIRSLPDAERESAVITYVDDPDAPDEGASDPL